MDKFTTPGVLFVRQQIGFAEGMMKLTAPHDAVGAHSGGHRIQTGGKSSRNSYALTFFGNRSTATRPGASRRRHNHRPDAALFQVSRDFGPHALHRVQAPHIAHGNQQLIVQATDLALAL